MVEALKSMLGSRRFWAAIITSVLVVINNYVKIVNEVQMAQICAMVTAWIVGESLRTSNS